MNQLAALLLLVLLALGVQSGKPAISQCLPGTPIGASCSNPVDVPVAVNQVTVTAINLTGSSFTCGAPSGTVIGALSVTQNIGSYTGNLSLSGTDSPSFQIVNGNLATNGTPSGCPRNYSVNVNSSLPTGVNCGLTNNCFQAFTVAGNSAGGGGTGGTVVVADKSGTTSTNYPLQFGRVFKQGDIVNFPRVLINGVAAPTQADVKNRWPDNSVKFAVIAVIIPSVPASPGTVNLTFQNQNSGNNTPLNTSQMLAAGYNFDATISIDIGGAPVSASARTMLNAGNCTPWTSGQIAQTMICADDSINRLYDLGFDSARPIRPRFIATWWQNGNRVSVRFVEESANTNFLQDVNHNLVWKLGQTSPVTVYSRTGINLYLMTSWSRGGHYSSFWINGAPQQQVNINYDIAYLASTKLFPNYDTSTATVSDATQQAVYNSYITGQPGDFPVPNPPGQGIDLGQPARWHWDLGAVGGREDIGPTTSWASRFEYTGDWRARATNIGLAENAAAGWQSTLREGASGKFLDRAQTIPALGHPISVYARPTLDLTVQPNPTPQDALVGSTGPSPANAANIFGNNGDTTHMIDPFSSNYLLTGDPFWLDMMVFWTTHDVFTGGANLSSPGNWFYRGAPGLAGAAQDNSSRADAWIIRDLIKAATFSPDGSGEKNFLTSYVDDTIAELEGRYNITGTTYQNTTNWTWANGWRNNPSGGVLRLSPMHFWESGGPGSGFSNNGSECGGGQGESPWMYHYLMTSLGRGVELGYKFDALLAYAGAIDVQGLSDPSLDHYGFVQSYRVPTASGQPGTFYTTWAQIVSNWVVSTAPCYNTGNTWANQGGVAFGSPGESYVSISKAAVSFIKNLTGGPAAITTWNNQMSTSGGQDFSGDTKWDFVPR